LAPEHNVIKLFCNPKKGENLRIWMSFHLKVWWYWWALENVAVFELQSVQIIDCNLAIRLIESKYLKMTKAIWIIEF
jgi:hypothetical protein